jgi:hypothetical protein
LYYLEQYDFLKVQPLYPSFESFYNSIKEILEKARNKVYRATISEMVLAYWNIGRTIFEEEQKGNTRADYGKQLGIVFGLVQICALY